MWLFRCQSLGCSALCGKTTLWSKWPTPWVSTTWLLQKMIPSVMVDGQWLYCLVTPAKTENRYFVLMILKMGLGFSHSFIQIRQFFIQKLAEIDCNRTRLVFKFCKSLLNSPIKRLKKITVDICWLASSVPAELFDFATTLFPFCWVPEESETVFSAMLVDGHRLLGLIFAASLVFIVVLDKLVWKVLGGKTFLFSNSWIYKI